MEEKLEDNIEVRFDTPQTIKLTVVGLRAYCEKNGIELSQLLESQPLGTTLFLRIRKSGEKFPGSVAVQDGIGNEIGSIKKTDRRYIELAIPQDASLPCKVVGHFLESKSLYVIAENNVGIKYPYFRSSEPEADELIFDMTEHDRNILAKSELLLTQLKQKEPNVEQILALAQEYAQICCTTLDGVTAFKVHDILRMLNELKQKHHIFDNVCGRIFEAAKDLGRKQNDVKTKVYLDQYNRILESAKMRKSGRPSQLEVYVNNLEFINGGKVTKEILQAEIMKLSNLLSKELMNKYIPAIDSDEDFATALYSLNYTLRGIYVLYTRRIKRDYLLSLLNGEAEAAKSGDREDPLAALPTDFQTEEAKELFEKLHAADILSEDYKPKGKISLTKKAVIASLVSHKLFNENRWAPFQKYWEMNNMSSIYNKAMGQKNTANYIDKIQAILK